MPHAATPPASPGGKLRPHAPLPDYYADEGEHRRFLRRLFDDTAADYDRVERLLALGSGRWYRRQALRRAGLAAGMSVVDVGCGTGLLAREALAIVGPGGQLCGVDPSPGMMAQARLPGATLIEGRAEALPLAEGSAGFLSLGYALRHIDDVRAALAEFRRVLAPGGRLLILEITRPEGRLAHAALKVYMRGLVPLLARLVARHADTTRLWQYYWDTIDACIAPPVLLQALRDAGFTAVARHVELGIFSEYTATRP